jgi:hypothetical protein
MTDDAVDRQYNERSTDLRDAAINAEQRNSSEPAIHRVAQPALHQFAVCVSSTVSVGSSHVTPRDSRKSWNGNVLRWRPRSSSWERICLPGVLTGG